MKLKKKLPPLVLIEWQDSARPEPDWKHLDNLPKLEVVKCVSVGWLVGDNEGVKMLAPNIGDIESEANAQASGIIRIPSNSVTRTINLIESDDQEE